VQAVRQAEQHFRPIHPSSFARACGYARSCRETRPVYSPAQVMETVRHNAAGRLIDEKHANASHRRLSSLTKMMLAHRVSTVPRMVFVS